MLSDEFSMDRMNNGDSDGFFLRRLVCRTSDSSYNWTDSWLIITNYQTTLFAFLRSADLAWHMWYRCIYYIIVGNVCLLHFTYIAIQPTVACLACKLRQLCNTPRVLHDSASLLSFLSLLSKLFVYHKLLHHLLSNSLLSNYQFGFRPGSSTQQAWYLLQQHGIDTLTTTRHCCSVFWFIHSFWHRPSFSTLPSIPSCLGTWQWLCADITLLGIVIQ